MEMPPPRCPICGDVHPPEWDGMCPLRLLNMGLEPPAPLPEEPLLGEDGKNRCIGQYELLDRFPRGGMGVVYKARHVVLKRMVALKMIAEAELASDAEVQAMLAEARAVASLDHPNIVPIYEVGEHEGCVYFTMKLMEGGRLSAEMQRFRGRPRKAARLVETIARSVHYAHQRRILHRDLKPANILLDTEGVPHVADFGVAQALDPDAGNSQPHLVAGTLQYMAPEQAYPRGEPLSIAADIYSLGVILYELMTGGLPFEADSPEELLAQLLEAEPRAPRELDARIPRDMEAICLRCLAKEPSQRYSSAAALAEELRRYLKGEETVARPRGPLASAWMWCLRHPLGTGLLVTLFWFLLLVAMATVSVARNQERKLLDDARRIISNEARQAAGEMCSELSLFSLAIAREAARPEIKEAILTGSPAVLEAYCRSRIEFYTSPHGGLKSSGNGSPFDRLFILNTAGYAIARWPAPDGQKGETEFLGKDYSWRDYSLGAQHLDTREQSFSYISRAFISEANKKNTFALSAPVYGDDRTLLGVLVATVASDSTLGALKLQDADGSKHKVTLVALTDRSREQRDQLLPPDDVLSILVHHQFQHGMPARLDPDASRSIQRALVENLPLGAKQFQPSRVGGTLFEGYKDLLSSKPGPWLAAFAPVGHTGFVVIVQAEEQAVLEVNSQLARDTAWWSLVFALGTGLVWLLFIAYRSWRQQAE